jgi:hypothetical protein
MARDASPVDASTPPATTLSGFDRPKPALKLDASGFDLPERALTLAKRGDRIADLPRRDHDFVREGGIQDLTARNDPQSVGGQFANAGASIGIILATGLAYGGVRAAVRGVDSLVDDIDDEK